MQIWMKKDIAALAECNIEAEVVAEIYKAVSL